MGFIYPRVVSVSRPAGPSGVGSVGYATAHETVIATGLAASIQLKKDSGAVPVDLPGDVSKRTYWAIFVPTAAKGLIRDRDIVIDDEGVRYQVTGAYWNSLGYRLLAERLEA